MAKRLLYGVVDIDMTAGPSEVLIVADATADPRHLAADLLAQAEHDEDARAILVLVGDELVAAVTAELTAQLGALPASGSPRSPWPTTARSSCAATSPRRSTWPTASRRSTSS